MHAIHVMPNHRCGSAAIVKAEKISTTGVARKQIEIIN
jgi:hypothetical protein